MAKANEWEDEEIKEMAVKKIHKLVNENLKREIEESLRTAANLVVEEVLQHSYQNNNNYFKKGLNGHVKGATSKSNGKIFVARDSLLTELLEVTHIRTIYHIFIVILIILFLNIIVYDFVDKGSINLGTELIQIGFGKMNLVFWIWSIMQASILAPYPFTGLWAHYRKSTLPNSVKRKTWDIAWISLYTVFQIVFLVLTIRSIIVYALPVASSLIILGEVVRMVMKMHAFIRSVSPRVAEGSPLPPFSCYLYFLFAPTLIYRDSYPRTSHIRWKVVMVRLLEIAAVLFYISFLCDRFLLRHFADFGKPNETLEAKQFVLSVFNSILPGLVTFLCGFYLLLHSWLNATSEVLTFADRQFYMDWWNQWSYGVFYRIWNMVVHDWLYTYIYMDILKITGNRLTGQLCVFAVSAVFHEIILCFGFGFFYPVLFMMFGVFGVSLVFLTKHLNKAVGNIFMWWSLAVGNGLLWSLYSMEYYARKNCPQTREGFMDLVIPRSWTCQQITLDPDWKFQNPLNS